MTATIVVDDGTNPPAAGSTELDNSFISTVFTLSNFNDAGVLAWRWTLVDRPLGSAALLATPTAASTDITPDIPGGYLVRLETFLDVAALTADDADEQVVRILFDGPYDWGIPAAGETNQLDSSRGWATPREEMIRDTRPNLWPAPTAVQVGAYTARPGDLVLYDPSGGTFQIDAPASPTAGQRFAIKNTTLSATAITVDGNGNSIENPQVPTLVASFSLGVAFGSIDYIFDGTNWVAL